MADQSLELATFTVLNPDFTVRMDQTREQHVSRESRDRKEASKGVSSDLS
ncbi:hypothetical protein [Lentibacillus saliphilus]|nr:hypothetical protein [Lentibacillus saliphilus]